MKRNSYEPEFKYKVVKEAMKERYSLKELAKRFELHPAQIAHWQSMFDKKASMVFRRSGDVSRMDQKKEDRYLKIIGQQKVEIECIKKNL